MAVLWPEESNYVKEHRKWDAPKRAGGMNRDGHEEYPKMLYRAQPHPISGRHEVSMDRDVISLDQTRVLVDAEAFNNSCQTIVKSEEEEERYKREGWSNSRKEAMEYHLGSLDRLAKEAALLNSDDHRMSERALAEKLAYEKSTPHHVAEVPESRRVRKPMSPEAKARASESLAKARAAKAAKKNDNAAV
jgi:hypothetical protein